MLLLVLIDRLLSDLGRSQFYKNFNYSGSRDRGWVKRLLYLLVYPELLTLGCSLEEQC